VQNPSKKNGKEAIVKGLSGVPRDQIDVKQAAPWRARQMFAKKAGEFSQKTHGKKLHGCNFLPTAPPIPAVLAFAKGIHAKHEPPRDKR
jgi:hypothetical protein